MSRRHSNLGSGPPRGPGHYSDDGRRWWEDSLGRWFPVTDQEDQLEIEVEDLGATSLPARLLTTLFTQYGTPYYRFVGRARSADSRWPTYQVTGASFPATGLDDPSGTGAWAEEQRARLEELHQQLIREGWRPAGHDERWWSWRYRRPVVDLTDAGRPRLGRRPSADRADDGGARSPGRPHPRSRSWARLPRDQPTRQVAARDGRHPGTRQLNHDRPAAQHHRAPPASERSAWPGDRGWRQPLREPPHWSSRKGPGARLGRVHRPWAGGFLAIRLPHKGSVRREAQIW